MMPYGTPELYSARRMPYNIIAGMFSIFSEPNLSNLVISAVKLAIIRTVVRLCGAVERFEHFEVCGGLALQHAVADEEFLLGF